jgi:hypothetical protein
VSRPYILAVDLGQTNDPTAVILLRRAGGGRLDCLGIERLPLGMSYPAQVNQIIARTKQPEIFGQCILAVDATGVGAPVVDLLRPRVRSTRFYAVTITSGDKVNKELGNWRIPKRDLIGAAQLALQQRRVKLPTALADAKTLAEELLAYKVTIAANGHDTYANDWRQAPHDDLVLALAIGVYVADHTKPRPARTFGYLLTTTRANV